MSLKIYDAAAIRQWDQFTIQEEPIASIDLMERAATLCTKHLLATNLFDSATLFCGVGNNGGDGLVMARLLASHGIKTQVMLVDFSAQRSADFTTNLKRLPPSVNVQVLNAENYSFAITEGIILDAIFGSGLNKPVTGWVGNLIDAINLQSLPIIAIDLPSGLFCTDNRSNDLTHVIRAHQTITFQSPKMAFLWARYAAFTGAFKVIDIGLSDQFESPPFARYITRKDILIKQRATFSHKGTNGFLLLVAGFQNYAGAAILSARAAMRSGSGYVAVHCGAENKNALLTSTPELLYIPELYNGIPEKTKAIAIGPGLGTDEHALNLLHQILEQKLPTVIDADALNLLASHRTLLDKIPANAILTPHPAELARLIGTFDSPEETLEKQIAFSKQYSVFVLQKGAYSKITTPTGDVFVNSSGNAGMGTAGMGDALTGIIGSLLAQNYPAQEATIFGTYLHGSAADLVKREKGEIGLIATDLVEALPKTINAL